jgi:hypothetical protein
MKNICQTKISFYAKIGVIQGQKKKIKEKWGNWGKGENKNWTQINTEKSG